MAELGPLAAHPIRLFVFTWLLCSVLARVPIPGGWRRWIAPVATMCSLIAVGTLIGLAVWYVVQPTHYDRLEPAITCLGWLWLRGFEIYPDVDSWVRYGHLYGPLVYLAQAPALLAFGPSVVVSKTVGLVALMLALVCLYVACRRHAPAHACWWTLGLMAVICLWFRDFSFWVRPDALLLFVVIGAVVACESRRRFCWNSSIVGSQITVTSTAG
jgi:hypothetical protein